MLKVAVCDDEKAIAAVIEKLLAEIGSKENIPMEIEVYYSGEELLRDYQSGERYDLLYLDIQMKRGDGIHAAEGIRMLDEDAVLIFISGYKEYMISLFRLDVYAFLPKPIDREEFIRAFHEVHAKIGKRNHYFRYRYNNVEYRVPCREILYFQSEGRKIRIHKSEGEEETFNGKLGEVERELVAGKIPFLRIHQSYLINYHSIRSRSQSEVVLVSGERVPISEDRKKQFGEEYGKLMIREVER